MYYRLLESGFEVRLALFVEGFLTGQTVRIRLGGPEAPAPGLPQGSPLSPVLFALYIAPLTAGRDNVYNYVDDVVVYASGRSYAEAKEAL